MAQVRLAVKAIAAYLRQRGQRGSITGKEFLFGIPIEFVVNKDGQLILNHTPRSKSGIVAYLNAEK